MGWKENNVCADFSSRYYCLEILPLLKPKAGKAKGTVLNFTMVSVSRFYFFVVVFLGHCFTFEHWEMKDLNRLYLLCSFSYLNVMFSYLHGTFTFHNIFPILIVCLFFFSRYQTLHYSFLNTDKHSQWMDSLLQLAPSARLLSDDEEEESTSSCKPDYTAHVLALNGHKKYFCLFRPKLTSPFRPSFTKDEDDNVLLHQKLDQLNVWMEKLTEGTLPRHHVPAWPDLHTTTPKK